MLLVLESKIKSEVIFFGFSICDGKFRGLEVGGRKDSFKSSILFMLNLLYVWRKLGCERLSLIWL